ncbi:MAG: GAP family protein [Solirubrobacterales bacterium]|nr:GAP family protein [Solirubrobacterales bacterium]MBV9917179.1 GAP family protein [Solirubrobacterales bacterium]
MGQAIGQILTFGVGIGLSPIPIIAIVLVLSTPKASTNAWAFLAGWIVGLALLGTIVLLVASGASASDHGKPATWVSVLKIALGVLLLALAIKQWRGRPQGDAEPKLPGWMRSVETLTPMRSTALGAALAAINPKNLLLVIGGAAAIAQTGASAVSQAVAMIVFIAIATVGVAVPIGVYVFMGNRASRILGRLHEWMARENATIMAVLCLIIGAKLIGDAISGLTA